MENLIYIGLLFVAVIAAVGGFLLGEIGKLKRRLSYKIDRLDHRVNMCEIDIRHNVVRLKTDREMIEEISNIVLKDVEEYLKDSGLCELSDKDQVTALVNELLKLKGKKTTY